MLNTRASEALRTPQIEADQRAEIEREFRSGPRIVAAAITGNIIVLLSAAGLLISYGLACYGDAPEKGNAPYGAHNSQEGQE